MLEACCQYNLLQNTVNVSVFRPHSSNGWALFAKQLAPQHCKLRCFLFLFAKSALFYTSKTSWNTLFSRLLCHTVLRPKRKSNKTLQNTVFSQLFFKTALQEAIKHWRIQCFLHFVCKICSCPQLQNTVFYSVFFPCWSNGSSLLAKQLAPKHCKLQCFQPILHQWPKLSCQTTCPKTLQIAMFSIHNAPVAQAFLPSNMSPACQTTKHCNLQSFLPIL